MGITHQDAEPLPGFLTQYAGDSFRTGAHEPPQLGEGPGEKAEQRKGQELVSSLFFCFQRKYLKGVPVPKRDFWYYYLQNYWRTVIPELVGIWPPLKKAGLTITDLAEIGRRWGAHVLFPFFAAWDAVKGMFTMWSGGLCQAECLHSCGKHVAPARSLASGKACMPLSYTPAFTAGEPPNTHLWCKHHEQLQQVPAPLCSFWKLVHYGVLLLHAPHQSWTRLLMAWSQTGICSCE